MKRETEPILRTPKVANMPDVLAQMQRSRSIHFVKCLPKSAFQHPNVRQTAKLSLPVQFVQENGHKIEKWVTLRAPTSNGRSSSSWRVRLCVGATSKVQMVGGWPAFVAGNRLQMGDYLIFLLKEDARSEFEVYMFRGPRASAYFPNEGERSDSEEEEENVSDSEKEENTSNPSGFPSPVHEQDEHNQAFRRDIREGNPAPLQHTENPRVHPGFSKRLVASNIGRSHGECNSGQFEFPQSFIKTHGEQVHSSVKLQGQWLKGRARASVFTYG